MPRHDGAQVVSAFGCRKGGGEIQAGFQTSGTCTARPANLDCEPSRREGAPASGDSGRWTEAFDLGSMGEVILNGPVVLDGPAAYLAAHDRASLKHC